MQPKRLLILPGDGIGPEILAQTRRVVEWFMANRGLAIDLREEHFGIPAFRAHGSVLPDGTWDEIEDGAEERHALEQLTFEEVLKRADKHGDIFGALLHGR